MNFSVCDDCVCSFLVKNNHGKLLFSAKLYEKKGTCTFVTPKLLF